MQSRHFCDFLIDRFAFAEGQLARCERNVHLLMLKKRIFEAALPDGAQAILPAWPRPGCMV